MTLDAPMISCPTHRNIQLTEMTFAPSVKYLQSPPRRPSTLAVEGMWRRFDTFLPCLCAHTQPTSPSDSPRLRCGRGQSGWGAITQIVAYVMRLGRYPPPLEIFDSLA